MPIKVTDYYTEARYYLERLAELYTQREDFSVVGLRLFSVYGPGEESKGVYANLVSQFIWAAEAGSPIEIYGDGLQTRDFIYVDDVVRAFVLARKRVEAGSDRFRIFNVGTGVETSVLSMAEMVRAMCKSEVPIKYVENRIPNYVKRTLADTCSASSAINFKANVPLDLGIAKTIAAYKKKAE
jgi:UDP-glucose 4-epimerase